ncbi:ZIP family metal transporter [Alkalibaculum sp. M08DMB]|uniref:ZIP family metal transporter n=1 Tax=Alkalibaculum sporogenes TaxID=2655001 RepID=A0A6A7KAX5_9FIRM|nr:ZIP family metal transporter [Alkalibaculum sporogenes]MPW26183.1 ZIP family metal transporter [Alkalibaculum sporogenes]
MIIDTLLGVTLLGFFAGTVGTGIGGISTFIFNKPSNHLFSFILGFSGGLMIAIVCFDLLPEAFNTGLFWPLIGIIIGVVMITIFDQMLSFHLSANHSKNNYLKTGTLMGVSIALHNFPEGLAIGSGLAANSTLGISLSVIILLHNIPEGMAMAAPLSLSGISKFKVLLYTIYAGLPMGVGALIGGYFGNISESFIGICLGFAGGSMLFITCQEIIPKSNVLWKGRTSGFAIIFGIICGILLSKAL